MDLTRLFVIFILLSFSIFCFKLIFHLICIKKATFHILTSFIFSLFFVKALSRDSFDFVAKLPEYTVLRECPFFHFIQSIKVNGSIDFDYRLFTWDQNVSCVEAINDHVLLCIRVQSNDFLVNITAHTSLVVAILIFLHVLHFNDFVLMVLQSLVNRQEFIVKQIELLGCVEDLEEEYMRRLLECGWILRLYVYL